MKVFVKTFGCELNKADSEVISGILYKSGFKLVNNIKSAKIVVVNTCGVKLPTQHKVLDYIKRIPKSKKVVVGGCLPRMIDVKESAPNTGLVFDTNSITKIVELIKKNKSFLSDTKENRIGKPVVRIKKDTSIIPISQGCLGEPCTYCSVKQARGDLKSYKPKDIIKEVKKAVKESCKNIHLTAQDTGCWGMDTKEKLSNLLNEVCKILGDFEVRLGMANPNHIIKNLEELIKAYKNPKMKKFLHIPVQSGSNKVLKDMKRKYTVQQFNKIVKKFRKEIPEIHIATDVILGFPTETKSDFKKTFNLIKEIKPEVLNISRYGIRQGTEAAKMKQLPVQEISKRSIAIHKLWKSLW